MTSFRGAARDHVRAHSLDVKFAHPFTSTRAAALTGRGSSVTTKGHVHERDSQNAPRGALASRPRSGPDALGFACELGVTYLKWLLTRNCCDVVWTFTRGRFADEASSSDLNVLC